MLDFSSHLNWFQAKIGSYDQQLWEASVEQRILHGLENRPKRQGSLNKELIDIDLVRGSTFSKAKPRHGLKSVIINGLKRVLFFPYYYYHWREHLTKEIIYCCLLHYSIQFIQLILYFAWGNSTEIMLEEILLPVILALCLGVLHAHIIAPYTVKQRRKKTVSTSSKSKQSNKSELISSGQLVKQNSYEAYKQISTDTKIASPNHQSFVENKTEFVAVRPEILTQPRKTTVLFRKTSLEKAPNDGDDDDEQVNQLDNESNDHTSEQLDIETEAKDSSSEEESNYKKQSEDQSKSGTNEATGTEGAHLSSRASSKRVKIADINHTIRKTSVRKFSRNEVADEEELKKFISAKNKLIPDPTPKYNYRKEKDKNHPKTFNSTNNKTHKSAKSRRPNIETCSPETTIDNVKVANKSTETESKKFSSICVEERLVSADNLNGIPSCENSAVESWINCNEISPSYKIETLRSKHRISDSPETLPGNHKINHSVSQPHTPINHSGCKIRGIEVRKVSSADASPTPTRKGHSFFINVVQTCEELKQNDINRKDNVTLSGSSQEQISEQGSKKSFGDVNISSEDLLEKKNIELNEDTITKSHRKREEFKQLFEINAKCKIQQDKAVSYHSSGNLSSSSSTKYSNHEMPNKPKRRHSVRKQLIQTMSETECDRMNSDVNSSGISTSDGEDVVALKNEKPVDEIGPIELTELNNKIEEETIVSQPSKNENNFGPDEIIRPSLSGDPALNLNPNEDPFVLWYKEAHAPMHLHGVNDSVSCYVWEDDELKKTNLSLLDIGWSIIQAVERREGDKTYSGFGLFITVLLCFSPIIFRVFINWNYLVIVLQMIRHTTLIDSVLPVNNSYLKIPDWFDIKNTTLVVPGTDTIISSSTGLYSWADDIFPLAVTSVIGSEWPIRLVVVFGVLLRTCLYLVAFLMLSVAESSFAQRLQYAKNFCRLTSSRRARKYHLPHFRLNKLANIKCWLSLRSYLKKRGPQRSVESIISFAFYMLLTMLSLVCVNLLHGNDPFFTKLINWDLMICSIALAIFMMRFLIIGTQITKKYRNLSVIITEQINLFLAMQTRPHKKDELNLAHNVLRLAESLLKEVEGPFKVCGWSMNPFLYNVLKVVILSVFSTVLSDTLGFKMKLYKIKLNPANW